MKKILLVMLAFTSHIIALDFKSFLSKIQVLSESVSNTDLTTVLSRLGYNRDVLDELIIFTKFAIEHNPSLVREIIDKLSLITNPLAKAAIMKAISLVKPANSAFKQSKIFLQEQDFYKNAKKINYRFKEITYPGHLFICYMATNDMTYLKTMTLYLDFDTASTPENIDQILDNQDLPATEKDKFRAYVFFLETKRILRKHINDAPVKVILTNLLENLTNENIKKHLTEVLNDSIDNI